MAQLAALESSKDELKRTGEMRAEQALSRITALDTQCKALQQQAEQHHRAVKSALERAEAAEAQAERAEDRCAHHYVNSHPAYSVLWVCS